MRICRVLATPLRGTGAGGGGGIALSNSLIRIEWREGEAGVRVTDLASGRPWFRGPAGCGRVMDDPYDSWGTGARSWNRSAGVFRCERAELLEQGPLKASLLLTTVCAGSRLVQEFALYRGQDRVHCRARLLWAAPRRMLKLEFPTAFNATRGVYGAPYAVAERSPDAGEVPACGWAAVHGREGGIGIAAGGIYGFDIAAATLRMSVVRSPRYGSMGAGGDTTEGARPFMDLGTHGFGYVLTSAAGAPMAARRLDMPVHTTLGFGGGDGTLPPEQSGVCVEPPGVALVALKCAEDGDGWVVRLWESEGTARECVVFVLGRPAGRVAIQPYALTTLRLRRTGGAWRLEPCGLLESQGGGR